MADEGQPVVQPDGSLSTATPSRQRDAHGRFAPTAADNAPDSVPATQTVGDASVPIVAEPPRFPPALMQLATQLLTPDEIARVPDSAILLDVIQGRMARLPQAGGSLPSVPTGQPPSTPTTPSKPAGFQIEDFALPSEVEDGDLSGSLKAVSEYVNKLKAGLVTEVQQLRQQNAELAGQLQQSAQLAQQAAQSQHAHFWDNVVTQVPGMVEAVGRPSEALVNRNGPQAKQWSELAPLIAARAQAQGVPEQFVDYARAAREAWAMYATIQKPNAGSNGRPGQAVHGASRIAHPPTAKKEMSLQEDYEYRLANLERAWAARGGVNPFA